MPDRWEIRDEKGVYRGRIEKRDSSDRVAEALAGPAAILIAIGLIIAAVVAVVSRVLGVAAAIVLSVFDLEYRIVRMEIERLNREGFSPWYFAALGVGVVVGLAIIFVRRSSSARRLACAGALFIIAVNFGYHWRVGDTIAAKYERIPLRETAAAESIVELFWFGMVVIAAFIIRRVVGRWRFQENSSPAKNQGRIRRLFGRLGSTLSRPLYFPIPIVATVLVIIGSFGPWLTVRHLTADIGFSVDGNRSRMWNYHIGFLPEDGYITLACGVVAALAATAWVISGRYRIMPLKLMLISFWATALASSYGWLMWSHDSASTNSVGWGVQLTTISAWAGVMFAYSIMAARSSNTA